MSILRHPLLLVLLIALVSVFAAPFARAGDGPATTAQVASASRPVGSFRAVTVRAPVEVRLRQSGREALEIRTDARLQPLIETHVIDGRYGPTLEIALRNNVQLPPLAHVVVTVDFVNLRAVSVDGSGDVSVSGLTAEEFGVSIAGSGDVHLDGLQASDFAIAIAGSGGVDVGGQAKRVKARISGSGDINAERLAAEEVSVHIAGSGDASVQAVKTLDVSIAGSGDVVYRGDPRVTRAIAGSGSVERR